MTHAHSKHGHNFDSLAQRFTRNIYGGLKGQIRLKVLQRDFDENLSLAQSHTVTSGIQKPVVPWRILDAGGGQGQFSLELARAGHHVTLCDISVEMLKLAEEKIRAAGLEQQFSLRHCAIQELAEEAQTFDLVLCHAVLEWVDDQPGLLQDLLKLTKDQGYLSLTFYNRQAMVYKNLLRTNFKKLRKQSFSRFRGSLTPNKPLNPDDVERWLEKLPLKLLCKSGIRVFHDYILDPQERNKDPQGVLEMELRYSREEPYRSLGRYIHILAKKTAPEG